MGPAGKPEVFRLPGPVIVWWVWVVFAVANLADLAVRGRDHLSAVVAAALVLLTGIAYVTALRPRIVADEGGVTLRNPFREHRVPWGTVVSVDLGESVQVRCAWEADAAQAKVLHSWAVHSSRRAASRARRRAQRDAAAAQAWGTAPARPAAAPPRGTAYGSPGYGRPALGSAAGQAQRAQGEQDAERIVRALDERAARERERGAAAAAPSGAWSWVSAAAILLPAVALVIVILV
jgi:hypothetical protein